MAAQADDEVYYLQMVECSFVNLVGALEALHFELLVCCLVSVSRLDTCKSILQQSFQFLN